MEFVKVIIVGGGAAGLGAAKTLGPDIDYILVEAQDYLGGRIRPVDAVSNVVVDLGAQFIHGEKNNIVYEICKSLNCILSDQINTHDDMLVITSDRTELDLEIMKQAFIIWENILEEAQEKFNDKTIPKHLSLADYIIEHFKERLTFSIPSASENVINAIMDYCNHSELIENGCLDLTNLSLAEYGSFEYLEGIAEIEFQNGGYRPFLSYMKSFLPNANRIRLNSEVIQVKYLADKHQLLVHIRHRNQTDEQQITTIVCEHMIWTSSLGYLKENFSRIFSEEIQLIEQKRQAIDNLGFDTVNKVVLVYDKRFWLENIREILLLHTDEQQLIQLANSFTEIFSDEMISLENIKTIIKSIHRYDVLSSTDVPVLICWFGGLAAVLIEDYSDLIIGQICHRILCHFLNIPFDFSQLIRIIKSEWHKNQFIRGSYSYYSIKSPMEDGDQLRAAYAPDGIPRIQFAGEATHEKFYSTVHGALESGIREGNKLLSIINP